MASIITYMVLYNVVTMMLKFSKKILNCSLILLLLKGVWEKSKRTQSSYSKALKVVIIIRCFFQNIDLYCKRFQMKSFRSTSQAGNFDKFPPKDCEGQDHIWSCQKDKSFNTNDNLWKITGLIENEIRINSLSVELRDLSRKPD